MTTLDTSISFNVHADYNGELSTQWDKITVDFNDRRVWLDVAETGKRHDITHEFEGDDRTKSFDTNRQQTRDHWNIINKDPDVAGINFRVDEVDNIPDEIAIESDRKLQDLDLGYMDNSYDQVFVSDSHRHIHYVVHNEIYTYADDNLFTPATGKTEYNSDLPNLKMAEGGQ